MGPSASVEYIWVVQWCNEFELVFSGHFSAKHTHTHTHNFQGQSDASALSRAILLMVLSLWDWPIWSPLLSYCGATPAFSVLASSALPAYLETEFMVGGLSLDTAQVLCSLVAALDAK